MNVIVPTFMPSRVIFRQARTPEGALSTHFYAYGIVFKIFFRARAPSRRGTITRAGAKELNFETGKSKKSQLIFFPSLPAVVEFLGSW